MDFGNACLFNKKPEDMRRIGALGGRARSRNLRLREACPVRVAVELRRLTRKPPLRPSGASIRCAPGWLVRSVVRHGGRADEVAADMRADVACKENYASCV